jgi:phosphonate transport system substrate-binding protein
VQAFYAPDEAALIQAIRSAAVQLAWLTNAGAIEAVDSAGAEVFARRTFPDTGTGVRSLLVVKKSSSLQSLGDVIAAPAGTLSYRTGESDSISGLLVPAYYAWFKHGIDPAKHFRRVVGGENRSNLQAIVNEASDVAVSDSEAYERFHDTDSERALQIRIIWQSLILPGDPIVWRHDLPRARKDALRRFLVDYGASREGASGTAERKVLSGLGRWYRFLPSSNEQLLAYRQMAAFRERMQAESDAGLTQAEKPRRLQAIDARLAAFDRAIASAGQ